LLRKIFKYELHSTGLVRIQMHEGANVLSVQNQNGTLVLWAVVDITAPKVEYEFYVAMTGALLPNEKLLYHGTAQSQHGSFVLHVFEILT
jgi:hypothetical protein